MSRTKRRGVIPFGKRFENKYKPEHRTGKKSQPVETKSDTKKRQFTLAPCQICDTIECGNASAGHESPIIVAISSKGSAPAACSVFFKDNSLYNQTSIINDAHLSRREIQIGTAITALKEIHAFVTARAKAAKRKDYTLQLQRISQVIIETNSKWLVKWFAVRKNTEGGQFQYDKLSQEFGELMKDIGRRNEGRVEIKVCKAKGRTVAQQSAEAILKREEASESPGTESLTCGGRHGIVFGLHVDWLVRELDTGNHCFRLSTLP